MALFNRKPKEAPVTEDSKPTKARISEARVLGTSTVMGDFLQYGNNVNSAANASGALNLYNKSTAVSVPVNEVASAFAQLTPVLLFADGTMERQHDILRLLQRPSGFFDQSLFMETLAKNYLITGEAFIIAVGNIDRPPLQLQPVSPAHLDADLINEQLVRSWVVTNDLLNGAYKGVEDSPLSIRYLNATNNKELQQIRNFSTVGGSMVRGQSPLVSASKEVLQSILGGQHNVSLLERGGTLSLVFHFAEDMDEDDFLETEARVIDEFGGSEKAGRIAVTAGPNLDIKEFGTTNKDMDFSNLQKTVRQVLSQTYHVPLPLVSTDAQTFNNYSTAKVALYDDAVSPLAKRLYGGLGELLFPRYDMDPAAVQITFDPDLVPALKMRRNEELVLRRGVNVETTDELRAGLGLGEYEPTEEPGGKIMVQSTLIPLGEDAFGELDDIPPAQAVEPVEPTEPDEGDE